MLLNKTVVMNSTMDSARASWNFWLLFTATRNYQIPRKLFPERKMLRIQKYPDTCWRGLTPIQVGVPQASNLGPLLFLPDFKLNTNRVSDIHS